MQLTFIVYLVTLIFCCTQLLRFIGNEDNPQFFFPLSTVHICSVKLLCVYQTCSHFRVHIHFYIPLFVWAKISFQALKSSPLYSSHSLGCHTIWLRWALLLFMYVVCVCVEKRSVVGDKNRRKRFIVYFPQSSSFFPTLATNSQSFSFSMNISVRNWIRIYVTFTWIFALIPLSPMFDVLFFLHHLRNIL